MERKKRLVQQVHDVLSTQFRYGFDKSKHHTDNKTNKIFSKNTYKTYLREGKLFANYCKKYGCKTLQDCKQYASKYIEENKNLSASTLHTKANAIAKLYQSDVKSLGISLPERKRNDITRSRTEKKISVENYNTYAKFIEHTGLRRREAEAIRGSDLIERDGDFYVHVSNGKGGKERDALIIGDITEVIDIVKRFDNAGNEKVFPSGIPTRIDVHHYRATYASNLYKVLARPIEELSKSDKYFCRGDKKGLTLDKKAMMTVSKQLGHNRINVIAANYLYQI